MDERVRKYSARKASPERSRRRSRPQATAQGRKIPVVYYLCRNRHLEHPHFVEVPLASPDHLYLRDVINRLNALRGKGMASNYSWSCKRSYKSGFVWHDLSQDDVVLPAQGNEYVLKGSELFDQTHSDQAREGNGTQNLHNAKLTQQEAFRSSIPPPAVCNEAKPPPAPSTPCEHERIPLVHRLSSSGNTSPELEPSSNDTSCDSDSPGKVEYLVYNPVGAADASTQTEDAEGRAADHGSPMDAELTEHQLDIFSAGCKHGRQTTRDEAPQQLASLSALSSKANSFRIVEEEEIVHTEPRTRSLLMQLITCGTLSIKDHRSFGFVPTYKPRFSRADFDSPKISSSAMPGELDYLSENPTLMRMKLEDKEYFSGSLIETCKKHSGVADDLVPTLKRSSSYNGERSCKSINSKRNVDNVVESSNSKCLPRTIKIVSSRQPRISNETVKTSLSDGPRDSSAGQDYSCPPSVEGGTVRIKESSSGNGSSARVESFREKKDKVIKIEERLTSGARVIIQSRKSYDDGEEGSYF